jgi:hypothetical protein
MPKFKILDSAGPARPDGAVRRSATIQIRNAQFAGSKIFSATFEFRVVDQDCQIQLTTENWPAPKKTMRFAPVDFVTFMGEVRPPDRPPLRPSFPIPKPSSLWSNSLAVVAWTLSGQTPRKSGGAFLYRGVGTDALVGPPWRTFLRGGAS